jgi:hypothetical protein
MKERGQALVETAITILVLVLLLLVIIEGGRLFLAKTEADRIARETAEVAGSVGAPTSEVWDYANEQIADFGSTLGDVEGMRLTIRGRDMAARCGVDYPSASTACLAEYGDWIEVDVRVRVDTWFGAINLASTHLASAWRAYAPAP